MRLPLAQGCRICVCARADIRFANRIAVFQIERAEITYERQARLRNLQPRLPFFYAWYRSRYPQRPARAPRAGAAAGKCVIYFTHMEHRYTAAVQELPVYPYLDGIAQALKNSACRALVLTAETGAGKSTAVPLALLSHFGGCIVMLEPRRLAVQAASSRTAFLLNEPLGGTVGCRMRFETKVSERTRFTVMTEAVLVQELQQNPSLDGVSVVVLDEFHERSVYGDLALAFLHDAMGLRNDLFILVMSATIDAAPIAAYLGALAGNGARAPVLHIPGKRFPVECVYRAPAADERVAVSCAKAVRVELCRLKSGSMLVFLPGIGDIRRCVHELSDIDAELLILHSSVPFAEQKKALLPCSGTRRVILSSAVAETSLTVPDVRIVIDCGLCRAARSDAATGFSRLSTEIESAFSAAQRAGRAGRTAPGRCVRLWAEHDSRVRIRPPEILQSDLARAVLECAAWGAPELESLAWLDAPPRGAWQAARELLTALGCVSGSGSITEKGRCCLSLGVHPRIGCVALEGTETALRLAARASCDEEGGDERRAYEQLRFRLERLGVRIRGGGSALALLAGFPDRLARHCGDGAYQLASGPVVSAKDAAPPFAQWIAVTDAGSAGGRLTAYGWERLSDTEAESFARARAVSSEETRCGGAPDWSIRTVSYVRYGAIVLEARQVPASQAEAARAVCEAAAEQGLGALPLDGKAQKLLLRARFYAGVRRGGGAERGEEALDCARSGDEQALARCAQTWLSPFVTGSELRAETVYGALFWFLGGAELDAAVPEQITLANGRKARVLYEPFAGAAGGVRPVIEIIVQQLFGCTETPRVCGVPVLLRLLSPARRPLQVTDDLAGFWEHTWQDICREMRGRYPKHDWSYRPGM